MKVCISMFSCSYSTVCPIVLIKVTIGYRISLFPQLVQDFVVVFIVREVPELQISSERCGWIEDDSLMDTFLSTQNYFPKEGQEIAVKLQVNRRINTEQNPRSTETLSFCFRNRKMMV